MKRRMEYPEAGSSSVYAIAITGLVAVMAVAVIQIVMYVELKHRVSSTADLSALAASKAAASGEDGCAAAERLARRSHVRIASCHMDYDVATVTASARADSWWQLRVRADVKSRAAPIEYVR